MSETSQPSQFKEGDIAWMLTSTAFVWLMVISIFFIFFFSFPRKKKLCFPNSINQKMF